jgi:hypothetical protein
MDHYISPFNVGMAVVVNGTVTYAVQYTYDNVENPAISPYWFTHPTLAGDANNVGNFAFPVVAIRLNVSAGNDTATLTLVQAGLARG